MKIELKIPTMEDKDELKAVCYAVDKKYLSDLIFRLTNIWFGCTI